MWTLRGKRRLFDGLRRLLGAGRFFGLAALRFFEAGVLGRAGFLAGFLADAFEIGCFVVGGLRCGGAFFGAAVNSTDAR